MSAVPTSPGLHAPLRPEEANLEASPKPEAPASTASALSPGGPAIEVTPKAVEAIKKQILKRGTPDTSLRVGIRGGGCSGFSYVIEFHDGPPRPKDRVFDYVAQDGTPVRVVVDPKSLLYLNGSALEWEQTLMQQGFKFLNPQEKSSCGCGHSFTV
jgi:iron-sulfur cluster assembly protein